MADEENWVGKLLELCVKRNKTHRFDFATSGPGHQLEFTVIQFANWFNLNLN